MVTRENGALGPILGPLQKMGRGQSAQPGFWAMSWSQSSV